MLDAGIADRPRPTEMRTELEKITQLLTMSDMAVLPFLRCFIPATPVIVADGISNDRPRQVLANVYSSAGRPFTGLRACYAVICPRQVLFCVTRDGERIA